MLEKRKITEREMNGKEQYKKLKKISESAPAQRTPEWFDMRKTRITASNIGSCLRKNYVVCEGYIKEFGLENYFNTNDEEFCNPYSNLDDFLLQKAGYTQYVSSEATSWGTRLEDCCLSFYRRITGSKVREFGLIPHPIIPYLGCSPDGISTEGVMLEIKAPFRRQLKGYPPIYYWIQCQIQLEVCDLELCDFIECQIDMISLDDFLNETLDNSVIVTQSGSKITKCQAKGLYLKYKGDKEDKYIYPKWNLSYSEQLDLVNRKINKYPSFGLEIEYYYVKSYTLNTIKRNKEWFRRIEPMLQNVYKKMMSYTEEDYSEIKKQKETKEKNNQEVVLDLEDCLL